MKNITINSKTLFAALIAVSLGVTVVTNVLIHRMKPTTYAEECYKAGKSLSVAKDGEIICQQKN